MTGATTIEEIASALGGKKSSVGYECKCPAHEDKKASLSLSNGDKGVVFHCHAGCAQHDVLDALKSRGLWNGSRKQERQIVATYDYRDQHGVLVSQAVRYLPKDFRQRRPDGVGGWVWKMDGVQRLPYQLPEVLSAIAADETIYIVEGEKDADSLSKVGLVGTCNAGGAGKWQASHSQWLKGAKVIVFPDNDDPGRHHAQQVAESLAGIAITVKVVELPGLPPKGDVSDWLAAGGTREELVELARVVVVAGAAPFTPRYRSAANGGATEQNIVAGAEGVVVHLLRGSVVMPVPIRWLWRGHLARGKFHVFAGPPGAAKTTLALAAAATVTRPGRWPDGTLAEPFSVIIWSGEDGIADTLVPRLIAMGADMSRVFFVGGVQADGMHRPFDPARDMATLERQAQEIGDVGLVIIDPIVQAVSGDSHKNTEVRRGLQPFVDFLERVDAAGIGISHFTKGTAGRDPVERVTGSIAFGALPRIIFAVVKVTDTDGTMRRIFVRAKSNIGPDGGGFSFVLEQVDLVSHPGIIASRVAWTGAIEGTARELLAEAETVDEPAERGATDEALEWLRAILAEGAMRASDVQKQARAAGISDKALRTARGKLGVKPRKQDFGGGWEWKLPSKMPNTPDTKNMGTLGALGIFEDALRERESIEDAEDAHPGCKGQRASSADCVRCGGEGCGWCK